MPTPALSHQSLRSARLLLLFIVAFAGCATAPPKQTAPATPAELYGELFRDVQMGHVFADSKTFVDLVAKRDPKEIVKAYEREKSSPSFDLKAFVEREFSLPASAAADYRSDPGETVTQHIDQLWPVLTRDPAVEVDYSSRLALPERYVVPGGRFNEMYYFALLIQRYGHIPNGNRNYYLSRSQPPFFAAMVELLATHEGAGVYAQYREALQKEYDFWMEGAEHLTPGQAHRRVVRLNDGTLLNRYWDDRATPREESYREDLKTAESSGRPAEEVYRNLRAAAESGWDFSSRWFADGKSLATIRTVELIPVDLNSLLYELELTLMHAYESSDVARSNDFRTRANARRAAIQKFLWDPNANAFTDYVWREGVSAKQVTAATVVPLFFGVPTPDQAAALGRTVESQLLAPHGIVTTRQSTGQQWDSPNGWAPHQWMAIQGFRRYGNQALASTIAKRWVAQNLTVFRATGKLVEKYDVMGGGGEGGGGEYPLQDGFGWTNGVLRALLEQYPELSKQ
jgi:alpha,alpha-trehalase